MKKIAVLFMLLGLSLPSYGATVDVTVQWEAVEFAHGYKLFELKPGDSEPVEVYQDDQTRVTLSDRTTGEYIYQLYSCLNVPTGVGTETEVQCEEVSEMTEETFEIGGNLKRRVIFIHTDLLGSPAAESDEAGVVQ